MFDWVICNSIWSLCMNLYKNIDCNHYKIGNLSLYLLCIGMYFHNYMNTKMERSSTNKAISADFAAAHWEINLKKKINYSILVLHTKYSRQSPNLFYIDNYLSRGCSRSSIPILKPLANTSTSCIRVTIVVLSLTSES
ncbi:hypothetical protein BpHYR1_043112 [Brachionus plicatilis]|uniref:Uncharacterized protein n=1 Tax=Brachionus plicatilis TaxID=10195 RepID=A0A3M7RQE4_BRAPC|nr:hypothetical protein BpHYR1_043112 [Brachionus plicatilis]